MTKEELIEFLKENLTISANFVPEYYGSYPYIEIVLSLNDEVISETEVSLPL